MSRRKDVAYEDNEDAEKRGKSSLYSLASVLFLKSLECVKTFPTSTALYTKKVDFRLILTILIFLFAVPKLATQFSHSLKFLTHLISAIRI